MLASAEPNVALQLGDELRPRVPVRLWSLTIARGDPDTASSIGLALAFVRAIERTQCAQLRYAHGRGAAVSLVERARLPARRVRVHVLAIDGVFVGSTPPRLLPAEAPPSRTDVRAIKDRLAHAGLARACRIEHRLIPGPSVASACASLTGSLRFVLAFPLSDGTRRGALSPACLAARLRAAIGSSRAMDPPTYHGLLA